MKESFFKFKKKILIEVLVKCISISISCGLIGFAVPYIYIKIRGIELNLLYLILIALGITVMIFIILFLILKPSNIKAAKRIDNQLELNEKVQTMVEYENEDNFMVNLQREDTLNVLSNTPVKKLSMKFGLIFFLVIAIALCLSVTAIAIPSKEDESGGGEIIDPDYDLDDWTVLAIRGIIEEVKASTITESLKTIYINQLESLITALEDADKNSEMSELVYDVIDKVLLELDKENTNNEVFDILKKSETSLFVDLAIQINLLNTNNVDKMLDGIIVLISGSAEAIVEIDDDFRVLLKNSNLNKEDSLYLSLQKLADNLNGCKGESDVNEAVKKVIEDNKKVILPIIEHQAENKRIANYIKEQLLLIFGLEDLNPDPEIDDNPNNDDPNQNPDTQDPDKLPTDGNQGGLGEGNVLFGSDDEMFDPEEGKVKYGDVITSYYGDIFMKFESGELPEELRQYFDYYYDLLLGDINKDKEEE